MPGVLLFIVGALALFFLAGTLRGAAQRYRSTPGLLRYQALHLGLWVSAILSLSAVLATYRRLDGEQPNPHPFLNLAFGIIYVVVLVGSFLVLGFFMYREDVRKGNVKRRMGMYDRFLSEKERAA